MKHSFVGNRLKRKKPVHFIYLLTFLFFFIDADLVSSI